MKDEINRVLALPSFDRDELLKTIDEDVGLCIEIIGVFREEAAALISVMDDAIANENSQQIARAAHSLKGSALTIAAGQVAGLAHLLEDMGGNHDLEMAKQVFVHLEAAYEELEKIFDAMLPRKEGA